MIEKFNVMNRWWGNVQFTAEIEVTPDMTHRVKLGMAVKWAVKNRADLSGADLSGADISGADLYGANLSGADLSGADLSGADLSGANLSRANLCRADLYGADLYGADLYGADISRAENAELSIARTRILPEGALIGWKKCQDGVIVKMRIPEESPRSHAFGRKCRAKFVDVLEVFGEDFGVALHDGKTEYRAGERVEAPNWSDNWQEECAGGIHFFITRIEAENY